jgi:exonuclease SbcC
MHLTRLRLTAISPAFPGTVDLDFAALGPGLVAIVGPNGAGKTTLLESSGPGPIFRKMPSGDGADPVTYAVSRESAVVLDFTLADEAWRARLALDGPKRASNAVLERVMPDGALWPHSDGKVSTYDPAIRGLFPSYDVFLNSAFAGQGRGDEFVRRKPSQRKDLFAEMLGQQHYGRMATTAAACEQVYHDAAMRLDATIAELERRTGPAEAGALDLRAKELQIDGGATEMRQRELRERLHQLEAQQATAGDEIAAYRAAETRLASATAALQTIERDRSALEDDVARTRLQHGNDVRRVDAARADTVQKAEASIQKNQTVLGQATAIRAAVAAVAATQASLTALRARLTDEQAAGDATLQADHVAAKEEQTARIAQAAAERARRDTLTIELVPCKAAAPFDGCRFLTDALAAKAQIPGFETAAAPLAMLEELRQKNRVLYERQKQTLAATQREITELQATLTAAQQVASYEAPLAAAEARIQELTATVHKAEADAVTQTAALDDRLEAREAELTTRLTAAEGARIRLKADTTDAQTALAALVVGNEAAVLLQGQMAEARAAWDATVATLGRIASERDELARRRDALTRDRARLLEVRDRLRRVDDERLEWADLRTAFSKGGLPDLEIDAAGPTISSTTNAILHACFGPRFTVELVTQVEGASGQMKDEFTVRVIDNAAAAPEWRDIKRFSGGQKTILQEALMCAISLYVNERSPRPMRTLWRDETGAALDEENAVHYVTMLRRVRELGSYHQILFVTHQKSAAALADAQIAVADGVATVRFPPFSDAA